MLPEKDQEMATVSIYKKLLKFCHVVSEIYEWTGKQTGAVLGGTGPHSQSEVWIPTSPPPK